MRRKGKVGLAALRCEMEHLDLEQWKQQILQWCHLTLHNVPPIQLYAAAAVLIFTTILLFSIRLFKGTKSNTIVLTGLTGAGKTVLFYYLRDGSIHDGTVTSMEPNDDTFVLHSETTQKRKVKPVRIVDVPGHSRLLPKLDEYLPQAAAVVFVVDAVEFLPNCRAASEYLYDILTKGCVVRKKIPLLILCNKTDKVTAHSKEFISRQMGKEIDKLRESRSAISAADIANEFTLGVPGEPFSFIQCHNKVSLQDASGLTGEISQLEQFIREYVKPLACLPKASLIDTLIKRNMRNMDAMYEAKSIASFQHDSPINYAFMHSVMHIESIAEAFGAQYNVSEDELATDVIGALTVSHLAGSVY
ncbi:Signal recognition particle receptor subunit beta, partial [Mucuna pruriens]